MSIFDRIAPARRARRWKQKQELAAPSRYYGDGGTIHGSGELDVEVRNGRVVSVWFRCQLLPFKQYDVEQHRAAEMQRAYAGGPPCQLTGVEVLDNQR